MYIDTLHAYDRLRSSGMTDAQARTLLAVCSEFVASGRPARGTAEHALAQTVGIIEMEPAERHGWKDRISSVYRSKWFLRGLIAVYGLMYAYCWYLLSLLPPR